MNWGSNREVAEDKVLLLYLIDKIGIPVSNLQVTKIMLSNRFMNYFLLQKFLDDLSDDKCLESIINEEKVFYKLTDYGRQTMKFFENLIPVGIKKRIDETITEIKRNIKNETYITADYTPVSETEYIVECQVREDDFSLIDLKITVGSKGDARAICENWKKASQKMYAEIIDVLNKKRE